MPGGNPYKASPRGKPLDRRSPLAGRKPRVLAHVHLYQPVHNAGAELMLHAMLAHLLAEGWEVQVLATQYRDDPYTWQGIPVQTPPIDRYQAGWYEWADVVITHLDATSQAMAWARRGRPLVHVVHNHRQLVHHRVRPEWAQLVVWNSEWVKAEHANWSGESIVVRPPVCSDAYRTTNDRRFLNGSATLLNLAEAKGGPLFWRLARQRGDLRFVGVRGSYAGQHDTGVPRNGVVVANTPDVLPIYRGTRVLLVPSSYESWGRVAVEAMASGIPVIAHPTPGLLEALTSPQAGACAIFADRDSTQAWLDALAMLDDRRTWAKWSAAARLRSSELDVAYRDDLATFAESMLRLATPKS